MEELKGIGIVFNFTLRQQLRAKGFRTVSIILAALLFLLPAVIMAAVELFGGDDQELKSGNIETVFVVDNSGTDNVDFNVLNACGIKGFDSLEYISCESFDSAVEKAEETGKGIILAIEQGNSGFSASVILPETTELSEADAEGFQNFIYEQFQLILVQKSGLDEKQLTEVFIPIDTTVTTGTIEEEADPMESVKEVLSYVLPYLNIMILYFLVLFYGQSVANCVIMEKVSKLMDTFLVSVRPGAMIFGKVLAIVSASAMQFLLWVFSAVGGFAAGTALVKLINPNTDMMLVKFFEGIGQVGGAFSIPGAVVAVLIVLAGFLLYCSIAAIGGAVAGKSEDLSSTNVLFTMILIVSFFCTLGSGAMSGEMQKTVGILDFVPFTSILVTPSRLLLGDVSVICGVLSLAIILVVAALFLFIAGKAYRMMALYKGDPPTPAKLAKMLKDNR